MLNMPPIHLFWFRRDLRLADNAGLYHALKSGLPVQPVFIFDHDILQHLPRHDRRVQFIHQALAALQAELAQWGATLDVRHGTPRAVMQDLCADYAVQGVFANRDYEPSAIARDKDIYHDLQAKGITFRAFKDHVVFEKNEVIKADGTPYTVFTPYARKWRSALQPFHLQAYPTQSYAQHFYQQAPKAMPSLSALGFEGAPFDFPSIEVAPDLIAQYAAQRDYPAKNGTSKLGVHLRFGTLSVRQLAAQSQHLSDIFLNELIWRDFYQMILWHFPHVVDGAFKPAYNQIAWRNDADDFARWCEGQTGYPIVDAGMRELNATGFMHNRVRMITASFLTKHLLIDWRWGERYFAQRLLDFDLAANNGGWQWAAGSGCDAAPYFRIFNPYLQTDKFDGQAQYIKQWVPEHQSSAYPPPMIEHAQARVRCLAVYGQALKGGN
jgi:deoxyribodipyrimidine photo-lyase